MFRNRVTDCYYIRTSQHETRVHSQGMACGITGKSGISESW